MSILKKTEVREKPQLDLTGPEGNAFVVLGTCKQICEMIGEDWEAIHTEATSGDYEHLIETMDSHFGAYIDFLR